MASELSVELSALSARGRVAQLTRQFEQLHTSKAVASNASAAPSAREPPASLCVRPAQFTVHPVRHQTASSSSQPTGVEWPGSSSGDETVYEVDVDDVPMVIDDEFEQPWWSHYDPVFAYDTAEEPPLLQAESQQQGRRLYQLCMQRARERAAAHHLRRCASLAAATPVALPLSHCPEPQQQAGGSPPELAPPNRVLVDADKTNTGGGDEKVDGDNTDSGACETVNAHGNGDVTGASTSGAATSVAAAVATTTVPAADPQQQPQHRLSNNESSTSRCSWKGGTLYDCDFEEDFGPWAF